MGVPVFTSPISAPCALARTYGVRADLTQEAKIERLFGGKGRCLAPRRSVLEYTIREIISQLTHIVLFHTSVVQTHTSCFVI